MAGDCIYSDDENPISGKLSYNLNDLAISEALSHSSQNIDVYSNSWGPVDDGKTLGFMGPLTMAALEAGVSEGRGGLGSIFCGLMVMVKVIVTIQTKMLMQIADILLQSAR